MFGFCGEFFVLFLSEAKSVCHITTFPFENNFLALKEIGKTSQIICYHMPSD